MTAHFKRRKGADKVFKMKFPAGSEAEIEAFRAKYEHSNNFVYSTLVEMCMPNETALDQVQELAVSDPGNWGNNLWIALENRFTQEKLSQIQAYLLSLGKFKRDHNEGFKDSIDRFKKLMADVRAIDPT